MGRMKRGGSHRRAARKSQAIDDYVRMLEQQGGGARSRVEPTLTMEPKREGQHDKKGTPMPPKQKQAPRPRTTKSKTLYEKIARGGK